MHARSPSPRPGQPPSPTLSVIQALCHDALGSTSKRPELPTPKAGQAEAGEGHAGLGGERPLSPEPEPLLAMTSPLCASAAASPCASSPRRPGTVKLVLSPASSVASASTYRSGATTRRRAKDRADEEPEIFTLANIHLHLEETLLYMQRMEKKLLDRSVRHSSQMPSEMPLLPYRPMHSHAGNTTSSGPSCLRGGERSWWNGSSAREGSRGGRSAW
jgi:hypothetical protein